MASFDDFHLQPATQAVLANMEIIEPTPIQVEAIAALLAGKDVMGQSATGSGKTPAYGIPLVERLARDKRVVQALVLVPTRELASGRRLSILTPVYNCLRSLSSNPCRVATICTKNCRHMLQIIARDVRSRNTPFSGPLSPRSSAIAYVSGTIAAAS